ncbi:hypothetical protein GCM10018980_18270 [Streptomyces capoamus]|uniref:Uncharacterized protein n=1 Tax=Streptomyces capoamus TaxID=68183 RepID=A0A919C3F7_9ACTN|nr:hypothetical protein GCM10010501_31890 [Streptomyces libani subsp. rufus]GHG42486.1 hypothetical protein GCM10018980_18270 [Streptomyces capoamus]
MRRAIYDPLSGRPLAAGREADGESAAADEAWAARPCGHAADPPSDAKGYLRRDGRRAGAGQFVPHRAAEARAAAGRVTA